MAKDKIPVRTLKVRDQEFPISLNPDHFSFHATVGEVEITAYNREDLEKRISREISRQKVAAAHAIPVVIQTGEKIFTRAILRGQNERTHAYLFTLVPSGEKVAIEYPNIVGLEGTFSDADIAELNRLQAAIAAAAAALHSFRKAHGSDHRLPSAASLLGSAEKAGIEAEEKAAGAR